VQRDQAAPHRPATMLIAPTGGVHPVLPGRERMQ
jgi:hypothetical protein